MDFRKKRREAMEKYDELRERIEAGIYTDRVTDDPTVEVWCDGTVVPMNGFVELSDEKQERLYSEAKRRLSQEECDHPNDKFCKQPVSLPPKQFRGGSTNGN